MGLETYPTGGTEEGALIVRVRDWGVMGLNGELKSVSGQGKSGRTDADGRGWERGAGEDGGHGGGSGGVMAR